MNTSNVGSMSEVRSALALLAGAGLFLSTLGTVARGDTNPQCASPEVYDLDESGMVAPADLLALIDGMNGPVPQSARFDIDGSGEVNEQDIDALTAGIEACGSLEYVAAPDDDSDVQVVAGDPQILAILTPSSPGPYAPSQQITVVVSLQRAQATGLLRARLIQFDLVLTNPALGITYPITHPTTDGGPIAFWDFSSTTFCMNDETLCGDNYFIDDDGLLLNTTYTGLTSSASRQITVPTDSTPVPVGLLQITVPVALGVYRLDMMNAANSDVNFGAEFRHGFGSTSDPGHTIYRASTGQFAGGLLDLVVEDNVQCVSGTPCESDGIECTDDLCVNGQCTHSPSAAGSPCGDQNPLGPCDLADVCDGAGNCLANLAPVGTVCRGAVGECDLDEQCDGQSTQCPADLFEASGSPCGNQLPQGPCDAPDSCNDTGICLANLAPGGTPCRPAIDECDESEFCNGIAPGCPADSFASGGAPCADDGNECTEDACNGAGQCDHAEIAGCGDIPTVSTWGLLILSLLLAVAAKLRFRMGFE